MGTPKRKKIGRLWFSAGGICLECEGIGERK